MNQAYQVDPPVPHVHFHVRPRYKQPVEFQGIVFEDREFGEHYAPTKRTLLPRAVQTALVLHLRAYFLA